MPNGMVTGLGSYSVRCTRNDEASTHAPPRRHTTAPVPACRFAQAPQWRTAPGLRKLARSAFVNIDGLPRPNVHYVRAVDRPGRCRNKRRGTKT